MNLYDNPCYSPIENLMCSIIGNQTLSSPFNFIDMVDGSLNQNSGDGKKLRWSARPIDQLGGSGTVVRSIIKLKKCGLNKGVKRTLMTPNLRSKSIKLDQVESLLGNMNVTDKDPGHFINSFINNYHELDEVLRSPLSLKILTKSAEKRRDECAKRIKGRCVVNKFGKYSSKKCTTLTQPKITKHLVDFKDKDTPTALASQSRGIKNKA